MTEPAQRYRLSPPLVVRLAGSAVVATAVLLIVVSVVLSLAGAPGWVLLLVVLAVLAVLSATAGMLRATSVVTLDDAGYRVRLIRGAGTRRAAWAEVTEAVAAHPRGLPCLVLRLTGDRTTTIPVQAVAGDRDDFARAVRARLQAASERGGAAARAVGADSPPVPPA